MRILQICKKNPYPPRDGETKAIHSITTGLMHKGCDLTVLTFNTSKHFVDPKDYAKAPYPIITIPLNNQLNYIQILKDLLRGKSPNFNRFYSIEMASRIKELLESNDYDIIHLEGSYLLGYIPGIKDLTDSPIAVRTHNVEYQIWERLSEGFRGWKSRLYRVLASRMKGFEKSGLQQADAIVPISCEDQRIFESEGLDKPYFTIPMGVNGEFKPMTWKPEPLSMAFLGSMDWEPNIEGVNWFLEQVWPLIIADEPEAKMYLAGRNMAPYFLNLQIKGVVVMGEIKCPSEFLSDKQLTVIPLLSGSGMRIKAIEAMSLGVPVLSTSIGVEGIPYKEGEHLLIADGANEFADRAIWSIRNPEQIKKIAEQGQEMINFEFDNYKLSNRLKAFYQKMINR